MKKTAFQKLWAWFHSFHGNLSKGREGILKHIHSQEKFRLLVEQERIRTERTGLQFSLVTFETGNQKDSLVSIENLVNILTRRSRITDEVGWFSERRIGVLLINTSTEGAWKFASDVLQKVPDAVSIRSCEVYTYPGQWQMDYEEDDFRKVQPSGHTPSLDHATSQEISKGTPFPQYSLSQETADGMERYLARRPPRWKRIIDITGSLIGLIVFSPVMLVVAVSIKLTSSGPVLFKQKRVGFLGKTFTLLKFRSMTHDNDSGIHQQYIEQFIKNSLPSGEEGGQNGIYKIENDPRVTSVGRLLRKTSLDELPQFINVLRGEMSLVGPRPPIPYEYEYYDLWHKRRAWEVKPGITGLWQIKGRSQMTFDQMTRVDLKYLKKRSLWLDLKILFQTPWVVFKGKGAY